MSLPWMVTASGRRVPLLNPFPEDIDFNDIAHHLAQINRYTGACKFPYSVAQHCVLMHDNVEEPYKLHALLHDAHEAYVSDMSSPMKHSLAEKSVEGYDAFKSIAEGFDRAIYNALGKYRPTPNEWYQVRIADKRAYATEMIWLLPHRDDYAPMPLPFPIAPIRPMAWFEAKEAYLDRLARHVDIAMLDEAA